MKRRPTLGERVATYAVRHWLVKGMTKWPTVRETARALRVRQRDIEECEGDGWFMLASYYTNPPQPLGDHVIEADTPEVEAAWTAYWAHWMPTRHPIFGTAT